MKQGFGKLASLEEAKKIIYNLTKEKEAETIDIDESLNRVLAKDIVASLDVPHFKKSAMDGFAVIAKDTFGATNNAPKKLKIIDSVTAGMLSKKEVVTGTCIEITTGAPLPNGANAVLMVEYTEKNNDELTFYKAMAPEENTIKIGSDTKV